MICILICDGDALFAKNLGEQVSGCLLKRNIAASIRICDTGAGLRGLLSECRPDLIFLGLSLRDADGFRLAEEIRAQRLRTEIVFVTNHPERMPGAFSYRPIGFITKPASPENIEAVVNRFLLFYWNAEGCYCVRTRGHSQQVPLRDILYFESSGHRVFIHLESQPEPLHHTRRLDEVDQEMHDRAFIRIHKSFLVRLDAISHIDRSKMRVILKDGVNLPISRRQYAQVLEQFQHYQQK